MSRVVLHTSKGDIALALDEENAPATVANFLQYVREGHYDNTLFHRVIPGFMIRAAASRPACSRSQRATPSPTKRRTA
jgi:peptidyl-prolyl cis-trans isomerase B (cyclophilin B)